MPVYRMMIFDLGLTGGGKRFAVAIPVIGAVIHCDGGAPGLCAVRRFGRLQHFKWRARRALWWSVEPAWLVSTNAGETANERH